MEISSSQRAALRSLANALKVVLYVGKEGVGDRTVKEAYDALQARELVKCAVMRNAPLSAREACEEICRRTGAAPVQVIGNRFVLYRRNDKNPVIEI